MWRSQPPTHQSYSTQLNSHIIRAHVTLSFPGQSLEILPTALLLQLPWVNSSSSDISSQRWNKKKWGSSHVREPQTYFKYPNTLSLDLPSTRAAQSSPPQSDSPCSAFKPSWTPGWIQGSTMNPCLLYVITLWPSTWLLNLCCGVQLTLEPLFPSFAAQSYLGILNSNKISNWWYYIPVQSSWIYG